MEIEVNRSTPRLLATNRPGRGYSWHELLHHPERTGTYVSIAALVWALAMASAAPKLGPSRMVLKQTLVASFFAPETFFQARYPRHQVSRHTYIYNTLRARAIGQTFIVAVNSAQPRSGGRCNVSYPRTFSEALYSMLTLSHTTSSLN